MKKVKSFFDSYSNIKTNFYETEEGLKVVESINKNTTDFNFNIVVNAGAKIEDSVGVPKGTAHFLEHILFGNPNSFLKSKEEMDEYVMGNKKRARIYFNAETSINNTYYYAWGNNNASERIMRFLFGQLLFPIEESYKYIEKERNIILQEKNMRPKDQNWEWLQLMNKIFKDFPLFSKDVLGEINSISSIKTEDLINFYKRNYFSKNIAISVQSNSKISKNQWSLINEFSKAMDKNLEPIKIKSGDFLPKPAVYNFIEESAQDVFVSIDLFYKVNRDLSTFEDYINDRLYYFFGDLFSKVGFDYIREEKNLAYAVKNVNGSYLDKTKVRGVSVNFSIDNFEVTLDALYEVMYNKIPEFILSEKGKTWLENILSIYIFRNNIPFDPNYAENYAVDFLNDDLLLYDYKKGKKAAVQITPDILNEFTKKMFKIKPIFWVVSPLGIDEIKAKFSKTKFFEHYKDEIVFG